MEPHLHHCQANILGIFGAHRMSNASIVTVRVVVLRVAAHRHGCNIFIYLYFYIFIFFVLSKRDFILEWAWPACSRTGFDVGA